MLIRKGIGAVLASGAMIAVIGLAGCAGTGPVGTGYASGYDSGYDADGVWLGGLYGGGGYGWWGGHDHDRDHRGDFAGTGRFRSAGGGLRGGTMHASADMGGGFFGGGGHFAGGFGGGEHEGGGFGGGGHGGGGFGGGGHR